MAKYTDDEIRNMSKITCKIAGEYWEYLQWQLIINSCIDTIILHD